MKSFDTILDELLYMAWLVSATKPESTPESRMFYMRKLRKSYAFGYNYSMKPERLRTILMVGA